MELRMKSLLRLASATLAIAFAIATPLTASASTQQRFSVAGAGAEAFFSTCPGIPQLGVVCTDTYINVANQIIKSGASKSSGTTLFLDEYSYICNPTTCDLVSRTFGFGSASLSIDTKLTKASATSSVPVNTCLPDGAGGAICADAGFVGVSATWSGVGDLQRQVSNILYSSRSFSEHFHLNGLVRFATASATVNGNNLGVSDFLGDMFNVKQSQIDICHIC
jgi:hypothetical protein